KEIELAKMSEKDKAKPADILEKIIGGKIAKIVNEVTLYGQPYVLDTNQSVEQVLKAAGAEVVRFERLAVGEGIEKVVEDYAAEVMRQAGLAYAPPPPPSQGRPPRGGGFFRGCRDGPRGGRRCFRCRPVPSRTAPTGAPRPATATASGSIPPFASRDPTMSQLAYRRVLLKLSGEALMGDEDYGIDPKVIGRLAREVIEAQQAGAEIALVIGGGNIFRGAGLAAGGMDRVTGD